jgi:hypothetical protein
MLAIASYEGGILIKREAAIHPDGRIFARTQPQSIYGYRWSTWAPTGERVSEPPHCLRVEGAELYRVHRLFDLPEG